MFNARERPNFRGNDRLARTYRSPSPTGTGRNIMSRRGAGIDEHRSRRDSTPDSDCLSNFYRERFGSRSPDDYLNLRLSQFDHGLSAERIKSTLDRELKPLKPVEIKLMRNPEDGTRLVYLNFERQECAKTVRRKLYNRLRKQLGKHLALDPSGVLRDQEGKYIPDRYNRAAMAAADHSSVSPPPPPPPRVPFLGGLGRKRSPGGSMLANTVRMFGGGVGVDKFIKKANFDNLNQDDARATRTLFVGNLPGDVRETELRRVFEIYGKVEAIETKILSDSKAAFSFVLYQTVEEAIKARLSQHDRPVRPGSTKCQIGYGKSQRTARLYVGGLGSWTTPEMLLKEFDRYGAIEQLEYEVGEPCAYIRFLDIDSAEDACDRMKNFDLRGNGKGFITVDFAKDDKKGDKRKRGLSEDSDSQNGLQTPSMSPTEAGYICLVDELREKYPSTWKGILMLKKAEYPLRLHRVFGKEDLLQDLLRDDAGNSLRLNISQRLPLDDTFLHKMMEYDKRDLALMVAPEGNQTNENLVKYLQEKNAAGVITINGGVVYVLAYSQTMENIIKFFAPRIAVIKPTSNHLLIALRKDNISLIKESNSPAAVAASSTMTSGGTSTTTNSSRPGFLSNTTVSLGTAPIMASFLPPPPQLPPMNMPPIPPKLPSIEARNAQNRIKIETSSFTSIKNNNNSNKTNNNGDGGGSGNNRSGRRRNGNSRSEEDDDDDEEEEEEEEKKQHSDDSSDDSRDDENSDNEDDPLLNPPKPPTLVKTELVEQDDNNHDD